MKRYQDFCCTVIKNAPNDSICKIDSSSDELRFDINGIIERDNGYNISIVLTPQNKKILEKSILRKNFQSEFHYMEIQTGKQIIFKAYDGFEIGEVSKKSDLAIKLLSYINDEMCIAL